MTEKETGGVRGERRVKIIAVVLLAAILGSIELMEPGFYGRLWTLARTDNMEVLVEELRRYGIWALFVSFVLDVVINVLGFLPSIFLSTANGVVFGIFVGTIVSWLGESVGVVLSFWLMRYLLRDAAEAIIAKSSMLSKIDELSGPNGFRAMLVARSIPYFPSGIITALGAVSKISSRDYILATFIGKFPAVALEVAVGHDIVNFEQHLFRLTVLVVAATVVYYLVWRFHKK